MKKKVLGLMIGLVAALPIFVNAEENAVKIGSEEYATLKDAVEAVEVCTEETCEPTTITVLASHETSGIKFQSGLDIVIDLGGYTVTFKAPTVGSAGTETQDMQILKGSTITFKNGKFVSSNTEKSKMFIQNYANLTLKDVEIDATNEQNLYALSNNSGDVSIEGTTSIKAKKVAFDVCGYHAGGYPLGPKVIVNTTGTIEGTIEVTRDGGTATRELSLVIKNINHVGELSIQEGLEKNVTIEAGSYTDEEASTKLEESLEEGTDVYEVIVETENGETTTKYVVATEENVENLPYETEVPVTVEELKKELESIKNDLDKVNEKELTEEELKEYQELKKMVTILEEKTIVSLHNIFYGSFIDGNYVINSNQSELEKTVKIVLELPTDLPKVEKGYIRKYSVLRAHTTANQEVEYTELPAVEKDGKVTFETDKFSSYILMYEDVKDTTNPNTFDGISLYMIIAATSLIGLVSLVAYSRKAKNN